MLQISTGHFPGGISKGMETSVRLQMHHMIVVCAGLRPTRRRKEPHTLAPRKPQRHRNATAAGAPPFFVSDLYRSMANGDDTYARHIPPKKYLQGILPLPPSYIPYCRPPSLLNPRARLTND